LWLLFACVPPSHSWHSSRVDRISILECRKTLVELPVAMDEILDSMCGWSNRGIG
jgi:hypothetical protein